jgi:hypothetical protein
MAPTGFREISRASQFLQQEKSAYKFLSETVRWLREAYDRNDKEMIQRIYDYAKWCMDAPRGKDASDDLLTIVTVSFFEHLPQHEKIRQDVGRWLPASDIKGMKSVFLYHGSEEQFQEMLASASLKKFKKL